MRQRRSCLSVPAGQERFHARAAQTAADEIVLDLEDSVAPALKARARVQAVDALGRFQYQGKVRAVRVNGCDTAWCYGDIISVVEGSAGRLDCLVVPKVDGPEQVHFVDNLLQQLELKLGLARKIGLELQIESARGLERVREIASAVARTEALIFGPGDLAASLRTPTLSIGEPAGSTGGLSNHIMARILTAARASDLQAIDGPYAKIRDGEGLRALAARAARLGYDGKWALHPAQVDVLNDAFTPNQAEVDRAWAILEAYRRATDVEQTGAVLLGEEMIDEATRRLAAVMLERGEAAGMQVSAQAGGGRT